PADSQTLYAGTVGGVFRSTNGGASWERADDGLERRSVLAMAIDPTNSNILYGGTSRLREGGVFKTTDGGAHWFASNAGLANYLIRALALDPTNPQTIYAGTFQGGAIFKSTSGGVDWTLVARELGDTPFLHSIAVDPFDP